ncbi:hypothetical protein V5O48_012298, partial [Marasmius crinis-equi]
IVVTGRLGDCDPYPSLIVRAFQQFTNLRSAVFNVNDDLEEEPHPSELSQETFNRIFAALKKLPPLDELVVNWAISERRINKVIKPGLRKLGLLWFFPDEVGELLNCLRTVSNSLTELHFRTDGTWQAADFGRLVNVFQTFANDLRCLKILKLARLDPAIYDEALFSAFVQLPQLEELSLEYEVSYGAIPYNPMQPESRESPPIVFSSSPSLTNLKTFALVYKSYYGEPRLDATKVCEWIKHVISRCPIEELSFRLFQSPRTRKPLPKESWDLLVDHLADKHSKTLRFLDLRAAFVKKHSLRRLLQKCLLLEELSIATSRGSIRHLRRVEFELRTLKRGYKETTASFDEVEKMMKSAPGLRRVAINEIEWMVGGPALSYFVNPVQFVIFAELLDVR